MSNQSQEEILRRLSELERENLRLKRIVEQSGQQQPTETTTQVCMFNGKPVIAFSGQFRSFVLDLREASVVVEKIDDIRHFTENNGRCPAATEDEPDPD
jgi:hypothetical protein